MKTTNKCNSMSRRYRQSMMRAGIWILVGLAMTSMLSGCNEESSNPASPAKDVSITDGHTIQAAKTSQWPSYEVENTDLMDPMPNRENIMVVLDMSGSMDDDSCSGSFPSKAVAAKSVLRDWVKSVGADTNLGLIIFDARGVSVRLPLGRENRDQFVNLVNESKPYSGTPLKTAVSYASQALEQQAALQQGYGTYKMMVITDGAYTSGENPQGPLDAIFSNAANPIEINTLGFCITDSALNQPGLTKYQSAKNPEELRTGLDSVLAESMDFQPIKEFENAEGV